MSRPNTFTKLIASILVITVTLTSIPVLAFAESTGTENIVLQPTMDIVEETPQNMDEDISASYESARILCELTENRTEFTKEYLLTNGQQVSVMYPEPVHYDVDGIWEEIDNTLVFNNRDTGNTLTTRNSPFRVEMPSNLASGKEITVSLNNYSISFALETQQNLVSKEIVTRGATIPAGEEKVLSTSTVRDSLATVRNNEEIASDSVYDVATPTKTYSGLTYNSVFAGVNLKYDLSPYTLKETIVINSEDVAARSYSFTLNAGTLTPTLSEDGSITLANKETGEEIFILQAPYLLDANEQITKDIEVILTKELTLSSKDTNTWTITYNLPAEWMDNAAYPVMLDPIVQAKSTILSIEDVAVAEKNSDPETFAYNVMYMRVGKDSYYGRMRSFVKFKELPALTAGDVVTYAALRLVTPANTSTSSMVVSASKVTSSWNSHTNGTSMTWATQPSVSSIIEDYQTVKGQGEYLWNVTDIAREWYQTGTNNGIALTAYNESASDVKKFYSSDNDGTNPPLPMLFIYHVNTSGLENYWDYTTVSANRAGVGYVNNFSGNLVWIHDDLGYAGNKLPVNVQHIYNSNDAASNKFDMGYGWRTNYNQLVYKYTDGNYVYDIYVWEDEDGTRHYFEYDSDKGCYVDEANTGLEMTVTLKSNGDLSSAIITDKENNKSHFDSLGRLKRIVKGNQAQSTVSLLYVSDSSTSPDKYKLSLIEDSATREYRFTYNSSTGRLATIYARGVNGVILDTITYSYSSSGNLTKISYSDGTPYSEFSYTGNHLLQWLVSTETRYGFYFHYSTTGANKTNKVVQITEKIQFGVSTESGARINLSYAHNETTIMDRSGHINVYQFNDWGNTICIQDDQGNAAYYNMDNNHWEDDSSTKNQLNLSSQAQSTVGSRLRYSGPTVWYDYWGKLSGYTTGTISNSPFAHTSTKSIAMAIPTKADTPCVLYNFEDNLYANPGESFTFSLFVNTKDVTGENCGFYLALGLDFQSANHSQYIEIDTPSDEWQRVEVTYTYLGTTRARLTPYIVFDGVGTVYVDSMQFEEGKSAGRLNLVSNNDISYDSSYSHLYNWTAQPTTNVARANISSAITGGKAATTLLDDYCLKLTGDPNKTVSASQLVLVSGQADDAYVFAGWAKGDSAPLTDNRTFGIKVEFLDANGDTINAETVSFNPDMDSTNTWQYVAGAAIADRDYNRIRITLLYDYNVNVAYFDGIQLYKETFGSSFTYDEEGNVRFVVDANNGTTEYKYEDNDLTEMIMPDGTKYEYTYDDQGYHNLETAKTPTGTIYTFEYDRYGNNLEIYVGTANNSEQMMVSAEYSQNGEYMTSITDTAGNKTKFGHDESRGWLLWTEGPEDTVETRTEYSYDSRGRLISTTKAVGGIDAVVANVYTKGLLSLMTHTTEDDEELVQYSFEYNDFRMIDSIYVGEDVLASYTYNNNYEKYLTSFEYGNNNSIEYEYDQWGRMEKMYFNGAATPSIEYVYDNSGKLISEIDNAGGTKSTYFYDLTNRLMRYEVKDSSTGVVIYATEYNYNELNNLESATETVNNKDYSYSYTYNQDNSLSSMVIEDTDEDTSLNLQYTYDDLGRLTGYQVKENAQNVISRTIQYKQRADGLTTTLIGNWIQQYGTTTKTHAYTFDGNSNIKTVTVGGQKISYVYDSIGQLTRVNDQVLNETWTYSYDLGGNILSKKRYAYTEGTLGTVLESISYGYTDSDWSDLLTSYNGNTITYDQIGNTLSDGTWTYTWENGRQLAEQSNGATTVWYTYDANGQRLTKESGNLKYYYLYDGITLKHLRVADEATDDTIWEMYFQYGQTGLEAIEYIRGSLKDTYYVVTNLQGDVIGLVDGSGTEVVSYTYDAWGNLRGITGSLASTVGTYNPIRYRGYVYDTETGFYYLNSRYYNPEWGRFISADIYVSTGQGMTGANMFAYCGNDPVNRLDVSGCIPLGAAFKALGTWLLGDGSNQIYGEKDKITKKIKKSDQMQGLIKDAIKSYKETGESTFSGTGEFTATDGYDLFLSTQKYSYEIIVSKETRTKGIWFWKRKEERYVVTVKVWDTYNFDAIRPGLSVPNVLNNMAHIANLFGVGNDYYWESSFTYYSNWEKI